MRCLESELVFWKALVVLSDGLWALGLDGNSSELENGNCVFNGETRFCSRVSLRHLRHQPTHSSKCGILVIYLLYGIIT